MKSRALFGALILAAAAGALAFRLPRLSQRPMHGDEAVQAVKAGNLSERGNYLYNPVEYHGPSLYYLSLPSIWLSSSGKLGDATEATFRIVPVLFGVGLVLVLLLVADGLGRPGAVCAALLTAVSPAMVFYSRYYVQEMLLVFFTFAAIVSGWRYVRSRRIGWAVLAGAAIGMMHATKETCIIAFGSMAAALVLTIVWERWRCGVPVSLRTSVSVNHLIAGVLAACAVSVLFFSSFLTDPWGPINSIRAYTHYMGRAGYQSVHVHPWYYYFRMLLYTKYAPGPWWSEAFILALAMAGMLAASMRKDIPAFVSFIAFYTLMMATAYSIIPYKTPWCMLGFLHGMILLAGVGAVTIVKVLPNLPTRIIACILLLVAGANLAGQAYRANYRFYADNRNPYVYAHPLPDVVRLAERIDALARLHPDGRGMVIKVIAPESDYWPLPWYLRQFPNVGYWTEPPADADAPVIIASANLQQALDKSLHDTYQVNFYGLRPKVFLLLYVNSDLWDAFVKQQEQPKRP